MIVCAWTGLFLYIFVNMKKIILTSILLASVSLASTAQIIQDGYYRVKNYGLAVSGNSKGAKADAYAWVCDNTGSVQISAAQADVHAIELHEGLDNAICNPASVIYLRCVDKSANMYDLVSQGTSVYEIIQYHPTISGDVSSNRFYITANAKGQSASLYAKKNLKLAGFYDITTSASGLTDYYRQWQVYPIASSSDNYFGVKPRLALGDKFYQPFYAAFPFKFASEGMRALILTGISDEGELQLSPISTEEIPAGVPMLIECSSETPSDNRLELLTSTSASVPQNNLLNGMYFCDRFVTLDKSPDSRLLFDETIMRVWGVENGKLVLSTDVNNMTPGYASYAEQNGQYFINANESFLYLGTQAKDDPKAKNSRLVLSEEIRNKILNLGSTISVKITAGINAVTIDDDVQAVRYYSAEGKAIAKPQRGVNIVKYSNGTTKKMVVE